MHALFLRESPPAFHLGLMWGVFMLFLRMAAQEWSVGRNLVAPAPYEMALGCFLGQLVCLPVRFNQTGLTLITWQPVKNSESPGPTPADNGAESASEGAPVTHVWGVLSA